MEKSIGKRSDEKKLNRKKKRHELHAEHYIERIKRNSHQILKYFVHSSYKKR